ncbi:MAG: hypothetical protein KC417_00745, partial [Myxococcales bacterium]|nr:hypothetical protein [Myxococcales bacterium]
VNVNAGVMPSVGTGIGFVRENDRAIGRNGLYAQMATGWTVGATKKFKSYRPELNQARGAMTKEFGLFSFDDPVKGINTMLELPVPLATWVPGGIIPGLGVAEHAGRPGVILSVQMPFTILPVVGPHVANFLNHAIPDGLPASSVLKRFAAVGSLRLGVVTTVYNPHLSGVVTRVNALARWFDPRLQRFVGALKGARKWVFSSPKVWRARIADLPARIRNVVRRGTSAETSARDIGVDGLRSELETSQLEGLQRNASELSQ